MGGAPFPCVVPVLPDVLLIELRQALISYQDYHIMLLALAGAGGRTTHPHTFNVRQAGGTSGGGARQGGARINAGTRPHLRRRRMAFHEIPAKIYPIREGLEYCSEYPFLRDVVPGGTPGYSRIAPGVSLNQG